MKGILNLQNMICMIAHLQRKSWLKNQINSGKIRRCARILIEVLLCNFRIRFCLQRGGCVASGGMVIMLF